MVTMTSPRRRSATTVVICLCILLLFIRAHSQLFEEDRVAEYHRQGYSWPPLDSEFVPSTKGWIKLHQRRLDQFDLLHVGGDDNPYNAYLTALSSGMIHNYTQYGFGVTKGPSSTYRQIQNFIQSSIGTLSTETVSKLPLEDPDEIAVDTIEDVGDDSPSNRPKFLALPDTIRSRTLEEMKPILEAWVGGIQLEPISAYGLRIYSNTSKLYMHLDHRMTHVISAIFHIGHDTLKPWPLVIEDFTGTTNEVYLHPGDMLLYESSKCWHGRPRRMDGNWYTSLFVHFRPVYAPTSEKQLPFTDYVEGLDSRIQHRIPPHWSERHETTTNVVSPKFVMPDTFGYEPDCIDGWCSLEGSTLIEGPAPESTAKF